MSEPAQTNRWPRKFAHVALVAGLTVGWGCRGEPASGPDGAPSQWFVAAEPLLTIGRLEGDSQYEFFDIAAGAVQADGDIVVADAGAGTVRLYDPNGDFKATLGGSGSGPGEFQTPIQIMLRPSGQILVLDGQALRITEFAEGGGLVGSHDLRWGSWAKGIEPPMYPGSIQLLAGGELIVRLIEKDEETQAATASFRPRSGALRASVDGSAISTLMLFGDREQVTVDSPWGPLPVTTAFARTTTIAVQPTEPRTCIGEQDAPSVVCFDHDGSSTLIQWPDLPPPRPPTRAEIDRWRETSLANYVPKLTREAANRLLDLTPEPSVRPPYSNLVMDHAGNLWVERGPIDGSVDAAIEHLVFDRAGALLSAIELPRVRILEIGSDYVLAVAEDEVAVQQVQILELNKPRAPQG